MEGLYLEERLSLESNEVVVVFFLRGRDYWMRLPGEKNDYLSEKQNRWLKFHLHAVIRSHAAFEANVPGNTITGEIKGARNF